MGTKEIIKSQQRQRLDSLIQEGLALLICELCNQMKNVHDTEKLEKRTGQIERLSEVYRRLGD